MNGKLNGTSSCPKYKMLLNQNSHKPVYLKLLKLSLFLYLSFGRWGAQIGFPKYGVYIFDVVFFLSIMLYLLKGPAGYNKEEKSQNKHNILVIFICSILILYWMIENSKYSFITLIRDLLPLFMVLLTPILIRITRLLSKIELIILLRTASAVSSVWYGPQVLGILPTLDFSTSSLNLVLFSSRNDWSTAVLAIGISVWGKRFGNLKQNYWLVSYFSLIGFLQLSRIGTFVIILSILSILKKSQILFWIPIIIAFASIVFILIPEFSSQTSGINRAFNLLGYSENENTTQEYTARARVSAWTLVIKEISMNQNWVFGLGPGREIIKESKAFVYLSGKEDVRSPHNFFLTLMMRFGFIGTIIWISYYKKIMKLNNKDKFTNLINHILRIIIIISSVGVILENLFALIPFNILYCSIVEKDHKSDKN